MVSFWFHLFLAFGLGVLAFGFWFHLALGFWLLVLASLGSSLGSWLLPSGFWFFDFTWLVVLFSPVFFTWIEIDRDRHT